ncbi:MAG: hypothetical protein FVQ80_15465 [Planctomycetes bacterium]|nr:hypothetical protein [Planctomycetota bacterium]
MALRLTRIAISAFSLVNWSLLLSPPFINLPDMDGLEVLMPLGLRSGWECNSIQVMIRLLFIDDDPGVQKTLKMVLSESYQVISAFTGNAGLNAILFT